MQAIIIDDEPRSRNLLSGLITERYPDVRILGLGADAAEGIRLIRQYHPDVVFLDIHMPGMNGFDMLRALQPARFDTVFVTAYDNFAIKAFRYNAFDYLLKPIDTEELARCMERLQEKKVQTDLYHRLETLITHIAQPARLPDRITIHSMDGITIIPVSDIIYLEAAGAYTLFYWTDQQKVVSSIHLKQYEELLVERGFFRSHHAYLLNMAHVRKFLKQDGGCILMSDGSRLQLSKRKREDFLRLLKA